MMSRVVTRGTDHCETFFLQNTGFDTLHGDGNATTKSIVKIDGRTIDNACHNNFQSTILPVAFPFIFTSTPLFTIENS
jgi:hypothetical protein